MRHRRSNAGAKGAPAASTTSSEPTFAAGERDASSSRTNNSLRWTVKEVADWAAQISPKLRETFIEHEICGETLLGITENDLNYLGIRALGQRKKLLRQIELLRQEEADDQHGKRQTEDEDSNKEISNKEITDPPKQKLTPEQVRMLQKQQETEKEQAFRYTCLQYLITFVLFIALDQTFGRALTDWLSGKKSARDQHQQIIDRIKMEQLNQAGR